MFIYLLGLHGPGDKDQWCPPFVDLLCTVSLISHSYSDTVEKNISLLQKDLFKDMKMFKVYTCKQMASPCPEAT